MGLHGDEMILPVDPGRQNADVAEDGIAAVAGGTEMSAVGQSVPRRVESKCTTFEGENGSI